jgi:predicted regulator of Ras-like GTPase activity (Roadblock/LC7/MglB family)
VNERFDEVLDRLSRVPGVRGAMIVDADAGVPVVSELAADVDGVGLAALTASLFRRAGRAVEATDFGRLAGLQLESEYGHLLATGSGTLAVVVLAEASAQLGQIRLEARRAAESLP